MTAAFVPSSALSSSVSTSRALLPTSSRAASSFATSLSRSSFALLNLVPSTNFMIADERVFEPVLPDSSTLIGFGAIIALCIIAVYVWAEEVVPVSRTKLALSKKNGAVREYLDELDGGDSSRDFERWLFTDWLRKDRQKKPSAIPLLKGKWNSGDNPVLVASALIAAGVLVTSVTERITSVMMEL